MDRAKKTFSLSRQLALAGVAGFAAACLAMPVWAADGAIKAIQYDAGTRHFTIDATGPVKATVNTINAAGHKRVIVDVDNAEIATSLPRDTQLLQNLSAHLPGLRNITVNQYGGSGRPVVRILFELENDSQIIRLLRNQGLRLELEVAGGALQSATSLTSRPTASVSVETQQALDEQRRQITALQQQIAQLRAMPAQSAPAPAVDHTLKAENERLKATNTYLRNQLSMASATTPAAKNTVSSMELESQLLDSKRKVDRLTLEKQQLQNQLNMTRPPGSPSLEEIKRTLVVMNQRYDQLSAENRNLKSQLAATGQPKTVAGTADNGAALVAKQAEVTRLQNDVQSLRKQLQAQAGQPNTQVEEMKRTLLSMNQRYDQLSAENQKLKDENSSLQVQPKTTPTNTADLTRLRQQLTLAQQSLNTSIGTINEQNKEIAYLRNQVNDVKAGMDATSRTQLSQLRAERDEKATRIRELEQQLAAKSSSPQTSGSQTEVATLKRQLEQVTLQYQNTVSDLNRQMGSKNQQVQERERQLVESRDAAQERSAELQAQIAALQTQLDTAQRTTASHATTTSEAQKRDAQLINNLQTEVAHLKQQQGSSATATKTELAKATQENQSLKTQIASLQQAKSSSASSSDALKSQLTRLTQENQSLKTQLAKQPAVDVDALKDEVSQLTQENQSLKTRLASQSNQPMADADALKNEINHLSEENQSLKNRLANQPKQPAVNVDVLKDEIARLTEENQTLKAQKSVNAPDPEMQTQVTDLQSEIASLKTQYEKALSDAKQARQDLDSQKKVMMAKPAANTGSAALQKQMTELTRQITALREENSVLREKAAGSAPSKQATAANPEAEKNYQEGKAALTAGTLEKALEKFQAAQLLEPDNSRYTVDYSIALAQDQEYAEASDLLRRYLLRNPADREAYGQLGKIYLLNDQTEMATQALSRAIPIGTLNNYATALKKAGKNEDAENIFKMALKLNPNDSEVLFNLGNLYNATERLELARNSYLQAIQVKPDFAEAYYNLGLIYSKLGDRAKAVTHLEKFLQLSPNARNADTIRAYVEKLKV